MTKPRSAVGPAIDKFSSGKSDDAQLVENRRHRGPVWLGRMRSRHLYSDAYHDVQQTTAESSAAHVVPHAVRLLYPRSVVDVGCGNGVWLAAFKATGIEEVLGFDGDSVDRQRLLIPPDQFRATDLRDRVSADRTFDLAVSLEVAEHLPPERADSFVEDLAALSPAVMFSAAQPLQGGTGHINEQWAGYWVERFNRCGYQLFDAFRSDHWETAEVAPWYLQNLLLFIREDRVTDYPRLNRITPTLPLRVVHPVLHARSQARTPLWSELWHGLRKRVRDDCRRLLARRR